MRSLLTCLLSFVHVWALFVHPFVDCLNVENYHSYSRYSNSVAGGFVVDYDDFIPEEVEHTWNLPSLRLLLDGWYFCSVLVVVVTESL